MKNYSKILGGLFFLSIFLLVSCKSEQQKAPEADEQTETAEKEEVKAPESRNLVYVVHEVADYAKWKAGYDAHDSTRVAHGMKSIGVAKNVENANKIHISLFADDVEKAKAFANSDELKAKMEELGVQGPPEMHFLKEVLISKEPSPNDNRVIVRHAVEDFSTWKEVFDEAEGARSEAGMTTRAILTDHDNPNMVSVVVSYEDEQKVRDMIADENMKKKMEESGVVGDVDFQFMVYDELILK